MPRSVTSRATVVHSGLSACTTAHASSTSNSSTTNVSPRCTYRAPSCTVEWAAPPSTVPSRRPVPASMIDTGSPAAAADVDVGTTTAGPVPAGRTAAELAGGHEFVELRLRHRTAERLEVLRAERQLRRGAAQLRAQHVRVARVGDGRLDRSAEHRPRDGGPGSGPAGRRARRTRPATPSAPARPVRPAARATRACPGNRRGRRRRVRRCRCRAPARWWWPRPAGRPLTAPARAPAAPPAGSRRDRSRPVARGRPGRGRAAGAGPGRPPTPRSAATGRTPACGRRAPRGRRAASRRPTAADRRSGAPCSPVRSVSGGSHRAKVAPGRGEPSSVTASTGAPDQPGGGRGGIGHRRRGEHEDRLGPVAAADAAQPPEHVPDVRTEHPAVGVALVDDHVGDPAQRAGPLLVGGQDPAVQHVRVGHDPPRVPPHPVPLLAGGVPVVGRRPHRWIGERRHRRQLVAGQRLGRGEVEDAGARVLGQPGQRRQLVGQRLPGCGAGGHDDVPARPRRSCAASTWCPPRRADPAVGEPGDAARDRPTPARGSVRLSRTGTWWTWVTGCSSSAVPASTEARRSAPGRVPSVPPPGRGSAARGRTGWSEVTRPLSHPRSIPHRCTRNLFRVARRRNTTSLGRVPPVTSLTLRRVPGRADPARARIALSADPGAPMPPGGR